MAIKYEQALDGEWFAPKHKGFKHMCCDCAKVHTVDFKVDDNGAIWTRWRTDGKATGGGRKSNKVRVVKNK